MIEIREITADELEHWIGIAGSVRADRKGGVAEYVDWKRQAEDMVWLLASSDGEAAGAAFAYVGWHSKPGTGHGEVFVLPELRGAGVGSALYEQVALWVQERGCVVLETAVAEDDAASLAWVDRRGFREVGRNSKMVLDLTAIEAPEIDPPKGVEIVTWAERPELDRGMYEVALEAEPDIPGSEDDEVEPFEDWLKHHMQAAGDKPEATFVALAGPEVVGWAKFSLTDAMPTTAHHDLTGVKRSWRGRGVARALKATQIAWAKANGYEELQTRNDERNEPIRHLNEEFGYRPTVGRIYLQGPPAE